MKAKHRSLSRLRRSKAGLPHPNDKIWNAYAPDVSEGHDERCPMCQSDEYDPHCDEHDEPDAG
jgi:hypothetical protein